MFLLHFLAVMLAVAAAPYGPTASTSTGANTTAAADETGGGVWIDANSDVESHVASLLHHSALVLYMHDDSKAAVC
jgi:hypothetical protein